MPNFPHPYYFSAPKRILDLTLASFILVLSLPIFVLVSLLVKLTSPGSVIFTQKRSGPNTKPFTIYKFRTMYTNAHKDQIKYKSLNTSPPPTFKITNDPRYTRIGKFLAHTGLDELPQLINIIKNDMSFVGPRPFPIAETKKLPQYWQFRTLVKPGILSSWAISDRSKMTAKKWAKLDKQDLTQAGLTSDLKIILYPLRYWL